MCISCGRARRELESEPLLWTAMGTRLSMWRMMAKILGSAASVEFFASQVQDVVRSFGNRCMFDTKKWYFYNLCAFVLSIRLGEDAL